MLESPSKKGWDFSVPQTDDAAIIKDKMLELQNYVNEVLELLSIADRTRESVETAIKSFENRAMLWVEQNLEKCGFTSKTNVTMKKAYAQEKVELEVEYVTSAGEVVKKLTTYPKLKELLNAVTYIHGQYKNAERELSSAIDVCRFYPTKTF